MDLKVQLVLQDQISAPLIKNYLKDCIYYSK